MNFLTAAALGGGHFAVAGVEIDLPLATVVEAGTIREIRHQAGASRGY